MEKFFSNLGKGGDKKKNDDKKKDEKKNESSWQGGSGDMETIRGKNATAASRIGGGGGGGGGGGDNSTGGPKNGNVFANAGAGISDALGKIDLFNKSNKATNNRGGGQSLGGSKPGVVLSICLDQSGPLGLTVRVHFLTL